MTYSIKRNDLISALEVCLPVTQKRQTNQLLTNVRVSLNHALSFSATDTVTSVIGKRALTQQGPEREFAVSPASLLEACRRMPDEAVALTFKDGILSAKGGARSIKIATVDAEQLPAPIELPKITLYPLPGAAIKEAVGRVRFAVGESGRGFDGVRLLLKGRKLTAQVLTGYHAASTWVDVDTAAEFDVLVPPGLIDSLLSSAESSTDVRIGADRGALFVQSDAATFRYLSASDVAFPSDLISRAFSQGGIKDKLPTAKLVDSLKYVSLAAGREAPKVTMVRDGSTLKLTAIDGLKDVADSIETENVGPAWQASFNPAFLIPAVVGAGDELDAVISERGATIRGKGYEVYVSGVQ